MRQPQTYSVVVLGQKHPTFLNLIHTLESDRIHIMFDSVSDFYIHYIVLISTHVFGIIT